MKNQKDFEYRICPSILAADFMHLGDSIRDLIQVGCDFLHMDIMDGNFVPQISFGEALLASARQIFNGTIDSHLMIDKPVVQIPALQAAGADILIPHLENQEAGQCLDLICNLGARAGLAIDGPTVDLTGLADYLPRLEVVLVATGKVGKAGQKIDVNCLRKIDQIRALPGGDRVNIMVDIGINQFTIQEAKSAGANWFVASSAIFGSQAGIGQAYLELKSFIE